MREGVWHSQWPALGEEDQNRLFVIAHRKSKMYCWREFLASVSDVADVDGHRLGFDIRLPDEADPMLERVDERDWEPANWRWILLPKIPTKRKYHATMQDAVLYAYYRNLNAETGGGHEDPYVTPAQIQKKFEPGAEAAFEMAALRCLLNKTDDGEYFVNAAGAEYGRRLDKEKRES